MKFFERKIEKKHKSFDMKQYYNIRKIKGYLKTIKDTLRS